MHKQTEEYNARLKKYNGKPKSCEHCNILLTYAQRKNKFCCQSCAAKTNNRVTLKRKARTRERKSCAGCSNPVSGKGKYCSLKCSRDARHKNVYRLVWEEGGCDNERQYEKG